MNAECDRESELLEALSARRWPARCDEDLRGHVASCADCAALVDVVSALLDDHEAAWHDARVPPSGVVWWRAQLRAREDAARSAARPLAFIQGVAASVALWLVVALVRAIPPAYFDASREWLADQLPRLAFGMPDVARVTAAVPAGLLIVLGAWLVLTPLAIYFAVNDD